MNHAITIGDLFWPAIIIVGFVGIVVVFFIVLSIYASAFKD